MDDEANKAYDKRFFRFRLPFKPFNPFKVVSAFVTDFRGEPAGGGWVGRKVRCLELPLSVY